MDEENCLHCVLSPLIQKFMDAHPEQRREHMAGAIAQCLGEFVGGQLASRGEQGQLRDSLNACHRVATAAAFEVFEAWDKRRLNG